MEKKSAMMLQDPQGKQPDDEEEDPIAKDVKDLFDEAQELAYGRDELVRQLEVHTDKTPELSGGDIDADWERADSGEEAVGGENPTPDQDVVEDIGKAVGLTYQDNEPLRIDDKLSKRDESPWELDPASSVDYPRRVDEEFNRPLPREGMASGQPQPNPVPARTSASAKTGRKTAKKTTRRSTPKAGKKNSTARGARVKGGHRTKHTERHSTRTGRQLPRSA
jgi:hypothetical protein